jgi:serine/threonine-protein kinase RsbW
MAEIPNICLSLANRAENVLVVRQALTGVARSLDLNAIELNDLNTAVTEACNNVVVHAYGGGEGPLDVELYALADGVAVVVGDRGVGIGALAEDDGEDEALTSGLGVPVMQALSRHLQIAPRAGGGTKVRMEFDAPRATQLELPDGELCEPSARRHGDVAAGAVELRLAPNVLARAVLPRVLSALAARAYFSVDRISDVEIVADVLAAKSQDSLSASHLDVGVTIAPRDLRLRMGPLHSGAGETLLAAAADGLAPVIERLTDEHHSISSSSGGSSSSSSSAETLELRLVERGD